MSLNSPNHHLNGQLWPSMSIARTPLPTIFANPQHKLGYELFSAIMEIELTGGQYDKKQLFSTVLLLRAITGALGWPTPLHGGLPILWPAGAESRPQLPSESGVCV
eukprot:scaffold35817_cov61-Cyclotella_meneghiniana.AAC.3